jgi:hypothetical protein
LYLSRYWQGGLVPSWQTTVVVLLGGTTTVVFAGALDGTTTVVFAGGFGSLLLMQPESSAAATKKQDAIFIKASKVHVLVPTRGHGGCKCKWQKVADGASQYERNVRRIVVGRPTWP